jgi:hypothetical protein
MQIDPEPAPRLPTEGRIRTTGFAILLRGVWRQHREDALFDLLTIESGLRQLTYNSIDPDRRWNSRDKIEIASTLLSQDSDPLLKARGVTPPLEVRGIQLAD